MRQFSGVGAKFAEFRLNSELVSSLHREPSHMRGVILVQAWCESAIAYQGMRQQAVIRSPCPMVIWRPAAGTALALGFRLAG